MKKINESFICIHCGKNVPPAHKTCRNHCPFCFTSLHVDGNTPGLRETDCHAPMYPTSYELKNGEIRILFTCSKCGKLHWNKRAEDDEIILIDEIIKEKKKYFL